MTSSKRLVSITLLVTAALVFHVHCALAQHLLQEADTFEIFNVEAKSYHDDGSGIYWQQRLQGQPAGYMRVLFGRISSPTGLNYSVLIKDKHHTTLKTYRPEEFVALAGLPSEVFFADDLLVEVVGPAPPTGLRFTIDNALSEKNHDEATHPKALVPKWKTVAESANTPASRWAISVAKLYMGDGSVCSGFLVSSSWVLTNYHCLAHSTKYRQTAGTVLQSCGDISAQFDYDLDPSPEASLQTPCVGVVDSDPTLDYALLQVNPAAIKKNQAPRPYLVVSKGGITQPTPACVVHHPGGLATRISSDCRAVPGPNSFLVEHDCDTIMGSSGAPLISMQGEVIGLHAEGPFDSDATQTDVVSQIVKTNLKEGKNPGNYAVSVNSILEKLKFHSVNLPQ